MRTFRGISLGWLALAALVFLIGSVSVMSRGARGEPDRGKDLDQFLDELYQYGLKHNMWNVRPGDGRFLQVMAGSMSAKKVLELGTANGYSGIWIGRALRETGGRLTTVEIDAAKAKEAVANFEKAGMSDIVEVKVGDVAKVVPSLGGPFDLIFLDTEKGDYLAHFRLALPLLRPGGVFLAHNVVLMRDSMREFLKEIESRPDLVTAIAQTSDDGFSVTYKKR